MDAETVTSPTQIPVTRKEILAWASYDVANATYAAVVATAVYNAYFVDVIAGHVPGAPPGFGTVLLTAVISISSILVVLTAPIVGTICDARAAKKKFLFYSTFLCICATAVLAFIKPGEYVQAMILLIIANLAFGTGEDLIAAFLPELSSKDKMGKISSIGWAAGYIGGLIALGGCLGYMSWAKQHGQTPTQFIPASMLICACYFGIAVVPTFVFLRERAVPETSTGSESAIHVGFRRFRQTLSHAQHYRDLFSFLLSLTVYSCGTTTIIHLASVYAQQVFGFTAQDLVKMILVINVTAAIGAVLFGYVQDRIGSIKTLAVALCFWLVAIAIAATADGVTSFWVAGNLVGIAMGASGSVGRALVGQFSPPGRSGEFLGLWGVAVKLATAIGALSFGLVTYLSHSNYRLALISTAAFFVAGILLLIRVNEARGRAAASLPEEVLPPGA